MKVLLIDDDASSMQSLIELLSQKRIKAVAPLRSIQEGIETIEAQPDTVAFTICNYRGGSSGLLSLYLQLVVDIPSIVFTDPQIKMDNITLAQREARIHFIGREDLPQFLGLLDQFCEDGVLESQFMPDAQFVKISSGSLNLKQPLSVNIYLRLARDRYCLRFRREDGVDPADLERYCKDPRMEFIYVKKEELDQWLASKDKELDYLLHQDQTPHEKSQQVAQDSLDIVHNVVSQLGFDTKTEEIAKKTVALTLKALGSSPQLSDILRRMQLQEGKYIASHSLMLAEIACALAHKLTWSSAPTFLKLTVAAFLHDLYLPSNRLARMRHIQEIDENRGFTAEDAQAFKTHPIHAAEYSRKLRQLPADVDTIVLQHHERPDGSGFPRGLYHHQISPLACVFIVAQDLLEFFMDNPPAAGAPVGDLFSSFVKHREVHYGAGNFRKILESLKSAPEAL